MGLSFLTLVLLEKSVLLFYHPLVISLEDNVTLLYTCSFLLATLYKKILLSITDLDVYSPLGCMCVRNKSVLWFICDRA